MSREEGVNRLTLLEIYYELLSKAKLVNNLRCFNTKELSSKAHSILRSKYSDLIAENLSHETICLKSLIPIALDALALGADPYVVSKYLTWRDFEEFILGYLDRFGYFVVRNLRFGLRRYEVDVLAVDYVSGYGLVIDCKHWTTSYKGYGRIVQAAKKHRHRVNIFARECIYVCNYSDVVVRTKYFIPILVTLLDRPKGVIEGVFVVPVRFFKDFLNRIDYYVDLARNEVLIKNEYYLKLK